MKMEVLQRGGKETGVKGRGGRAWSDFPKGLSGKGMGPSM